MTYKTLLVHVETSVNSDARLCAAVDLATRLEATLIGVGGRQPMLLADPLAGAFGGGVAVEAALEAEAIDLGQAEARFRDLAKPLGPRAVWHAASVYPTEALCGLAAAADLIVAGMDRGPTDYAVSLPDLLHRAGAPVLALPPGRRRAAFDRIMIAWKDTREARRAVTDALPLLHRAHEVVIASAESPSDAVASEASIRRLTERLEAHGVKSVAETVSSKHDPAKALFSLAVARGTDLIVAGAFGHSRAGEWLLGGMTQSLIDASPVPVLFSR